MKNEILYIWLQLALGICSSVSRDLLIRFDDIASVYSCEDFSFLGEDRAKYIKRLGDKNTSDAFEVM
ncbi:MAG: hypothetical protein J5793_04235, partial [Clostridia bacterium]|nr:hypothetical protein [Clostridia bacterium]